MTTAVRKCDVMRGHQPPAQPKGLIMENGDDGTISVEEITAYLDQLATHIARQGSAEDAPANRPDLLREAQRLLTQTRRLQRLLPKPSPKPTERRVVFGLLEPEFQAGDASGIIDLAAAMLACMATVGNDDQQTMFQVLDNVVQTYTHLRLGAAELLMTVASGLIDAVQDNKQFFVSGRFAPPESESSEARDR